MRTFLRALVPGLLFVAGCGLIDPDIADFDLSLPEKPLTVDTTQWQLSGETMPAIDCSENAGVCSLGVNEYCGADGICFGSCGEEQTCDVKVLINLWHDFNLKEEKPELEDINNRPIVSVTISDISYRISENTMNVDSPPLTVYVGPAGVMSPGDPQAQAIGTLPAIPAGFTTESAAVELTSDGRDILAEYLKRFDQPFNLIVGGEVDIQAGDPMPQGRLTAVVLVTAVAGI